MCFPRSEHRHAYEHIPKCYVRRKMKEASREKSLREIKEPRKLGTFHMFCNHHLLTVSSRMRIKIKKSFTLYPCDLMDARHFVAQLCSLK